MNRLAVPLPVPGQAWRGKKPIEGRMIRVTGVDGKYVRYEVLAGTWGGRSPRQIQLSTLRKDYELVREGGGPAVNGFPLDTYEAQVIASLRRISERWPGTLKVVIMNGELAVMRAGSELRTGNVIEVMRGVRAE